MTTLQERLEEYIDDLKFIGRTENMGCVTEATLVRVIKGLQQIVSGKKGYEEFLKVKSVVEED